MSIINDAGEKNVGLKEFLRGRKSEFWRSVKRLFSFQRSDLSDAWEWMIFRSGEAIDTARSWSIKKSIDLSISCRIAKPRRLEPGYRDTPRPKLSRVTDPRRMRRQPDQERRRPHRLPTGFIFWEISGRPWNEHW